MFYTGYAIRERPFNLKGGGGGGLGFFPKKNFSSQFCLKKNFSILVGGKKKNWIRNFIMSKICFNSSWVFLTVKIRDRPFNLEGGYGFLFRSEFFFRTTQELEYFFLKKYSDSQCCWKKYSSILVEGKKIIWFRVFTYNLMLNYGKKIRALRDKKKNSISCVVRGLVLWHHQRQIQIVTRNNRN
jgi:hypothetical protein